jgi:1,4-alpha-glucan branching enzyme
MNVDKLRPKATASARPGMGALPFKGGTTFRVWAPHAEQVYVAGTFDDWRATAHPLTHEGNGYWSTDVPGARNGDEYRFVIVNGDQELWRIDPYARQVTHSAGNGVIYDSQFEWRPGDYRTPAWNEWVIYEMHIGTFNDLPGGAPGNLDGAIRKLGYLKALGVNVLQLMPPMEFAGAFSWGYNPANLFAIEDDYGGPNALKTFVQAAHAHGLAVVFDVVYNHFGPSDLDLWQFDGWSRNSLGGIYFYNDWRAQTPWGHTRPDYGRPEVRQYIRDNALLWLEELHVDGLRWDATAYIRNTQGHESDPAHDIPSGWSLMQWINDEIDERHPCRMSIAEDLRDNAWITRDTSDGGAGFDAQWDARFVHPIREAIITPDDRSRSMDAIRHALTHRYNGDVFQRVVYTESHDEVANGQARVPEEIWHGNAASWASKKRSTLGVALVLTAPGIPMIFQGQEFLEDRWFHDQDPIDWSRAETFRGILQLYRDLIGLRRNVYGHTRGLCGQDVNVHHVNDRDKVIAFHRWDGGGPGDDVVVVANLANQGYGSYTLGFPRPGPWKVRLNSDWRGYDATFGNHPSYHTVASGGPRDGLSYSGNVGIGPYSVVILSQDSE